MLKKEACPNSGHDARKKHLERRNPFEHPVKDKYLFAALHEYRR
jgi:hypothetical protein